MVIIGPHHGRDGGAAGEARATAAPPRAPLRRAGAGARRVPSVTNQLSGESLYLKRGPVN
eukprot:640537-Prorocentrum_minimum.AAC.1